MYQANQKKGGYGLHRNMTARASQSDLAPTSSVQLPKYQTHTSGLANMPDLPFGVTDR